jgi:O-antigen/teichoic acid export membrane protein
VTAAQIAPLVAAASISLVIARVYGPSKTGVLSLVLNLFDVALLVFTLGLSSGITYLVSRQEWPLRRAMREIWLAATGLGIAGAVCAFAFYLITRHSIFAGVTPVVAIVPLTTLPFAIAWAFCAAAALGRHAYEAYATFEIGNAVILLVAGVLLAVAFGVIGVVSAFAAANVATALYAAVWFRRVARAHDDDAQGRKGRGALRRATSFGLQAWSANLLQLLNYRFDIFILSAVATRSTVGVYSIAVSVTGLGWLLPNAFQTVLFPRIATLDAEAGAARISAEDSDASAARAVRHSVLIMLPTAVSLVALVALVPLIYGPRFASSTTFGLILIPGVLALGIAKVLSAVFSGRGFPRYGLYTTAISVPITLGLYAWLIPALHGTGAALASTISYTVTLAVSVVYFRRATGIPLRTALIPSRSDLLDYVAAFRLAVARIGERRARASFSR